MQEVRDGGDCVVNVVAAKIGQADQAEDPPPGVLHTMSNLLYDAAKRASRYLESLNTRSVAPGNEAVAALARFDQAAQSCGDLERGSPAISHTSCPAT